MDLPGKRASCWAAGVRQTRYPAYTHSDRTDVAVIGGGIVGVTTAYLLAREGRSVTLLEARKVGREVSGRSTAKITSQHALIYAYLIRKLGLERTRLYAEANERGARQIIALVDELGIDCDLERKDAYAYTMSPTGRSLIETEAAAARRVGLDAEALSEAPLPFATAGALRFRDQAQFNPVRYLVAVARGIRANGGRVFEDTRVTKVVKGRGGSRWRVEAGRHHLDAAHVVVATNLPIAGPIKFDQRTRPRCHIVMAFRAASAGMLDGMFIDIGRPSHSLRMGRDADGPLLVVVGPHFMTGHERNVGRRFRELETWVRANVPAGEVAYRWVNEDYDSPDRVPFAGELAKDAPGMYVATGFNGWGISNGTACAMLIADQIAGRPSPWAMLYDPARTAPKSFNRGGDSQSLVRGLDAIRPGEGGVITHGRQKLAVWKAADGKPHALSASCTHMGCTVTWNNADLTWDCPCHGSMFTREGHVIHGPATEPLKPKRLPSK